MRKLIALFFLFSMLSHAQENANTLFEQHREGLFQIQLIELKSGNKSSIGSGFAISPKGDLISNYHVVADAVYHPDKYRIQALDRLGNTHPLKITNFDVINDLSMLAPVNSLQVDGYFRLSDALPRQGQAIYSLGNPHDLGMIVVPGTYNGLKTNSFYQRIHVTGSINPGMSGGPAVNGIGDVIGVNVATAGNQIGFLVPLNKIHRLVEDPDQPTGSEAFKQKIHQQLKVNQSALIESLLDHPWKTTQLGEALIPDQIADYITCWGGSNAENSKAQYLSVERRCRLDDRVYLTDRFQTGALELEFEWLASDTFSSHRFYNFFSNSISRAGPGNSASKDDVSNYECQKQLVNNQQNVTNRTVVCLRVYKDYPDLYDVLYIGASLDHQQQGLISHFTLAGVDKTSGLRFLRSIVEAIAWQ